MEAFLETPADCDWLRETHLKGVPLPSDWQGFQSAILQGNEYAPHAVDLYRDAAPRFDDDYLRVTFNHEAPIYCEYCVYDGATNQPKGMPRHANR